ncbi:hydrolase [Mangrovibacterium marinum]|uniref:Nicotinamidase-related amidase n=1 Tax=Mangrovibacterium marinum TaxID=1639118 RepID=A0A2T5C2B1_9BACT|nr:hydrolase [Mangrovibacterium marinum]PTN08796.1 nicotinamidase-related amidase [Mangrovibacterium marinum]
MRINKENTVGLIIDMQERLLPAMEESEALLENVQTLINGLQELNVPILATQQYTKGLGETVEPISSIIKDFSPIEKKDFSCCDETEFAKAFEKTGANNVIIAGIECHVCVLQTAIDLKEAGLNPVVVMDCVSSRSFDNVDLAAERFRHEGIMMTSYESILFELTRSASAAEFKAISKLVK